MPPAHVSTLLSAPATWPRALEVVNSPDLVRNIVCYLPNAGQVYSSRYVSRAWYGSCTLHLRARLDINQHIRRWFRDVLGFRRLQCELELVISGSFALNFFREASDDYTPTVSEASDMDLFVEWVSARDLLWFLNDEGFALEACFENNFTASFATTCGASIPDDSFERVLRYRRGNQRIDVVCTTASPIFCIFRFHCTLVINFITWNKAYCMYPFDTLVRNRGMILRENNDRTRTALDKYRERGFSLIPWYEGDGAFLSRALRAQHRWVGDAHCWTVDLNTTGVLTTLDPASRLPVNMAVPSPYLYELNGYRLHHVRSQGPTRSNDPIWVAEVDCEVLEDASLMFSYGVAPSFLQQAHRYLERHARVCGQFWAHRRLDPSRDATLLEVKVEHERQIEHPGGTPHSLYG